MSLHSFWPHVFFAPSIEGLVVEEFKPVRPRRGVLAAFHAICFTGRIRKGRGEEFPKMKNREVDFEGSDDSDPIFPAMVSVMVLGLLFCGGVFAVSYFLRPSLTCP